MQITARSDRDLTPEGIVQKVADSSGSKYSGEATPPTASSGPKPPIKSKPVFNPTRTGGGVASRPLVDPRRAVSKSQNVDEDGWGEDAPPVTRTQLEKVQPAYQPTKVNMRELSSTPQSSSTFQGKQPDVDDSRSDVVKGGYQPVGKVDIAAIRRQAQQEGTARDDRPEPVKGAYEPVGKVDIGAIRARSQKPAETPPQAPNREDYEQKGLGDQSSSAAPERLTTLPKPKVSNKFGGGSNFTGTKAPLPGGFGAKPPPPAAPVGSASRTFADSAGKTPAQLWAEKKAREGGAPPPVVSPTPAQEKPSGGEWKSSYSGKTWAPVQTTHTGKSAGSNVERQSTGERVDQSQNEQSELPSEGIGSIRERFAQAPPPMANTQTSPPPPLDISSKPNAGRGIPEPESAEESYEEQRHVPSPPPQPRSPTPPTPPSVRASSPIRVAMPVGRGSADENVTDAHAEQFSPPTSLPVRSLEQAVPDETQIEDDANHPVAQTDVPPPASNIRAIVQYDYEKAEDNEIELKEGEYVTEIDMVDEDWWVGVNEKGEKGLFPGSFVEVLGDDTGGATHEQAPEPAAPAAAQSSGPTATALYDYEAGEDNEISFPEDAQIVNIVSRFTVFGTLHCG